MKKNSNKNIINLAFAALFAAMVTIFILVLHIPNGIGGYVHIADAIIYLAACILPLPYAMPAAAVGGALADMLSGYPQYIIPTFIIKALLVPVFTSKDRKIINKRNLIATVPALAVNVVGYAITKYILYAFVQNQPDVAMAKAIASLSGNVIQSVGSAVLFVAVGLALDKAGIKNRLKLSSTKKSK